VSVDPYLPALEAALPVRAGLPQRIDHGKRRGVQAEQERRRTKKGFETVSSSQRFRVPQTLSETEEAKTGRLPQLPA